jgi:hypothetical protein
MVGAVLCFGAAVLTMIGTFQDLLTAQNHIGPQRRTIVITNWDVRVETNGVSEPEAEGAPLNGVPLLFAVAVLLAAAVLGMLAATRPSVRRFGRASGLTAVVAAAFLAATVATIGAQVLWWLGIFRPSDDAPADVQESSTVTVGPGIWTLVIGVGLAAAAAVTAWRQAQSEPPRVEPDTPRLGIPVVVRRLPDASPDEPRGIE